VVVGALILKSAKHGAPGFPARDSEGEHFPAKEDIAEIWSDDGKEMLATIYATPHGIKVFSRNRFKVKAEDGFAVNTLFVNIDRTLDE